MKIGQRPAFRALAAVFALLMLQPATRAHDIPDEIVLQSFVRPDAGQLHVLLRIPLLAIADANLPKDGTGYLALPYLDPALREAANQIANGIIFLEEDERLTRFELLNARISLPSDRSFDSYEGAMGVLRGPRLAESTQIYYNQGFLDLELAFPIQSEAAAFSMRVLFGRGLANRTATVISFMSPDGGMRTFKVHDDTPLVRLDPKAHQAAWVFLSAGFYRFLEALDHLLFVVVVALPYRRTRDLVKPVAAFAAAHTVAIAVAAAAPLPVDAWFVSMVGGIIGMSIVYVALENAVGAGLGHRAWLAACFGLFHGLGFSLALQDTLQFAGSHTTLAVASYTVGIDAATILVLAIAVPLVNAILSSAVPERVGIIAASVIAGHMGWHWMTDRFAVAQMAGWPLMDVQFLLVVVRWMLALTIVGGAVWFLAGLLRGKPVEAEPESPEKSIIPGPSSIVDRR